jgi:hypothetical protein
MCFLACIHRKELHCGRLESSTDREESPACITDIEFQSDVRRKCSLNDFGQLLGNRPCTNCLDARVPQHVPGIPSGSHGRSMSVPSVRRITWKVTRRSGIPSFRRSNEWSPEEVLPAARHRLSLSFPSSERGERKGFRRGVPRQLSPGFDHRPDLFRIPETSYMITTASG